MIISPDRKDFSTIFNILGRLSVVLSFFMLIPVVVAFLKNEFSPFFDFLIGFSASAILGFVLLIVFPIKKEVGWIHAFFTVSASWILFSLLGAIPLWLSSHFVSFLDAWFEAMSGFATTGLTLIQDLDHLSFAHNTWRHLTMFIGGQGIILASLSVLVRSRSVALGFYVGEARQEKILPNVVGTAQFIWKVSFVYLILGVVTYFTILFRQGQGVEKSLYHAFWLFFASFDTGGFAPQAQNIAYYHSLNLELATIIFMILGAINFNLHFWVWNKSKKEIFKNFEIKTFLFTLFSLVLILYFSFRGLGSSLSAFRGGFYQLVSAHSGCGFTNLSQTQLLSFPGLGLLAVIFAMMIGGGVCSTTGGIKLMRLGIIFRTFSMEIKRWMMPVKAVYRDRFHHLQDLTLSDKRIKEAYVFFAFFMFTYILGALVGMAYGYPARLALFESVSATANVGLSTGITQSSMPTVLKLVYIFQMWAGRLEFIAIFVSLGLLLSLFKK
ncbi:MAG: TrkH family potassium uptake protein [Candidatus Omnitrophica bacterium]|nr:TrkH family potassium uptake protein [Candidatus Omnitrophota bacterium]MBU2044236.1 TrkH family potassium uptake protein [Candidatus Omnitrophota bacterium]MBU2473447.1 TrkH family potassium uptake protein [Candidatus Omnitrophota bacterium]